MEVEVEAKATHPHPHGGDGPAQAAPPIIELPLFPYAPLPTATSIRLLKILPNPGPDIECSMTTVDLNDKPEFDALSYTWGNPITIYEKPDESPVLGELDDIAATSQAGGGNKTLVAMDLDAVMFRSRNHVIPYEKVEWNAERNQSIRCGNYRVMVSQNLLDALRTLHRIVSTDVKMPKSQLEAIYGKPLIPLIWIDAICINQADVAERNAQVRVMGRIYSSARTVLAWLGPEEGQSRLASRVIGKLAVCFSDPKEVEKTDFSGMYFSELIREPEWMSLFALLQRLWFRRAWIVQEAVLARNLVLMCGGTTFAWFALELVLRQLVKYGLHDQITQMGEGLVAGGPLLKFSRRLRESGAYVVGCAPQQSWDGTLHVNPFHSYAFVEGIARVRKQIGMDLLHLESESGIESLTKRLLRRLRHNERQDFWDDRFKFSGVHARLGPETSREPMTLEDLVYLFRTCDATNPRDKIFSLLGILTKSSGEYTRSLNIRVDYNMPTKDVYLMAARALLSGGRSLQLLSFVQDPSLTKVGDMPSWVPDFSVDTGTEIFAVPGNTPFSAAGNSLSNSLVSTIGIGSTLNCHGLKIGSVAAVADEHGCYFVRTEAIVSDLPQWYRSNHVGMAMFGGGARARDSRIGHICLPLYPPRSQADRTLPEPQPRPRPRQHSMTRVEAYWRTLVADCFEGEHPAPLRCGFGFAEWFRTKLARARNLVYMLTVPEAEPSAAGLKKAEERLDAKMKSWRELDSLEVGRFVELEELTSRPLRSAAQKACGHEFEIDVTEGGVRFLPDVESLALRQESPPRRSTKFPLFRPGSGSRSRDSGSATFKSSREFEARLAKVKRGHRMFRTTGNLLGMGPKSCQPGDEVWILLGAKVPFLLRMDADGRRKVVGECYVQGIMHGEPVEEEGVSMEDVVLS